VASGPGSNAGSAGPDSASRSIRAGRRRPVSRIDSGAPRGLGLALDLERLAEILLLAEPVLVGPGGRGAALLLAPPVLIDGPLPLPLSGPALLLSRPLPLLLAGPALLLGSPLPRWLLAGRRRPAGTAGRARRQSPSHVAPVGIPTRSTST
jgi:hypothetical protein